MPDARFEFQLRMFEKGAADAARVAQLDELAFKIKASFLTVWAATIGWSFTIKSDRFLPLALIIVVAFWMFEGMFRGAQSRYIDWSRRITAFVNDQPALEHTFAAGAFPPDLVFPLGVRETEWSRLWIARPFEG